MLLLFWAQAQGFLVLVTQGVGMLIGNQVFGRLVTRYTGEDGAVAWQTVWAIPAGFALLVLIVFVLLFRGKATADAETVEDHAPDSGEGSPVPA